MFEHLTYMPQAHQIALQTAVRNHNMGTGINPGLLGKLYKLALDGLASPAQETGFFTSTLTTEHAVLSTATDTKTGIFIQLARISGQSSPFLTVGLKWAMEGKNEVQGSLATLYW